MTGDKNGVCGSDSLSSLLVGGDRRFLFLFFFQFWP